MDEIEDVTMEITQKSGQFDEEIVIDDVSLTIQEEEIIEPIKNKQNSENVG